MSTRVKLDHNAMYLNNTPTTTVATVIIILNRNNKVSWSHITMLIVCKTTMSVLCSYVERLCCRINDYCENCISWEMSRSEPNTLIMLPIVLFCNSWNLIPLLFSPNLPIMLLSLVTHICWCIMKTVMYTKQCYDYHDVILWYFNCMVWNQVKNINVLYITVCSLKGYLSMHEQSTFQQQ